MPISVRVQWLPKAGNREDEYEDACWPDHALTTTQRVVHCAIADGATESAFAGLWARQLTAAYGAVGSAESATWRHAVAQEQRHWQAQITAQPLPWYAEEKARHGAFAALLGVTLTQEDRTDGHRWQASAVGDCVLFQVRAGALVQSFPAQDAAFFTNRPFLLSSLSAQDAAVPQWRYQAAGDLNSGDVLYLTTDALGQWCLRQVEAGSAPWTAIETALAQRKRGFRRWVARLRHRGDLRNDDVTLLRVAQAK